MSDNEIKISSRTILDVLAGKISQEDFIKSKFHPLVGNPFENKLKQGKLITSIEIEKCEGENDDELMVFKFGEADVAISDFESPSNKKKS